jgi:hypothetical protein
VQLQTAARSTLGLRALAILRGPLRRLAWQITEGQNPRLHVCTRPRLLLLRLWHPRESGVLGLCTPLLVALARAPGPVVSTFALAAAPPPIKDHLPLPPLTTL